MSFFSGNPERRLVDIGAQMFVAKLAEVDLEQLDEEQAAAAVAEAEQAALAAIRQHATTGLMLEAKAQRHKTEQEQERRKTEAERTAEIERDGRRALRQILGGSLAKKVESWTQYQVLYASGHVLAVPYADAEAVTRAIITELTTAVEEGKTVQGVYLGTALGPGERLDAIVATPDEAVALLTGSVERQREADAQRQRQQAQALAVAQEQRRQEREFGVKLEAGE